MSWRRSTTPGTACSRASAGRTPCPARIVAPYVRNTRMPSFDIVSKIDLHELTNALDQANRELSNRFDFKGTGAEFERSEESVITLKAQAEFQLKQMLDILKQRL